MNDAYRRDSEWYGAFHPVPPAPCVGPWGWWKELNRPSPQQGGCAAWAPLRLFGSSFMWGKQGHFDHPTVIFHGDFHGDVHGDFQSEMSSDFSWWFSCWWIVPMLGKVSLGAPLYRCWWLGDGANEIVLPTWSSSHAQLRCDMGPGFLGCGRGFILQHLSVYIYIYIVYWHVWMFCK